jgi:3-oxoacyl-[acyl-carrier-protein] synthase-3
MDGCAVFKWAVRVLTDSTLDVLDLAGLRAGDIRWFVPHQANARIIDAAAEALGFRGDAVFTNLDRYGNTSAGSIPIALDELSRGGRLRPGDRLVAAGFGAGLNWGTALWRW